MVVHARSRYAPLARHRRLFRHQEDLEALLQGQRSHLEIASNFRTAHTVYDQALQCYCDRDLRLDRSLMRHIHSELFRGKDERRGQFRTGGVQILSAQVKPPELDVEDYLRATLQSALEDIARLSILIA